MVLRARTSKDNILLRINELGIGAVFSPKDFLDVASRGMVDMTLKELLSDGLIRKVARGLYDTPRFSSLLNSPLSPDLDAVAKALARRFRWRIVPSGAHAANLLGLSSQIPAKAVYLTDGPSRQMKIGNRELIFKTSRPRDLGNPDDPLPALVIQALKHIGKEAVAEHTIASLRAKLPADARERLLRDARYASDWVYAAARAIAGDTADQGRR